MKRTPVLAFGVLAVLGVGILLTWLLWPRSSDVTAYDSPDDAVTAACHAASILGDYPLPTGLRVGWQEKGQPEGIGWSASIIKVDGRYAVRNCKSQGITHG